MKASDIYHVTEPIRVRPYLRFRDLEKIAGLHRSGFTEDQKKLEKEARRSGEGYLSRADRNGTF